MLRQIILSVLLSFFWGPATPFALASVDSIPGDAPEVSLFTDKIELTSFFDAADSQWQFSPVTIPLAASDAFGRTQSVLDHFGVSSEPDSQSWLNALSGRQTQAGIKDLLPSIDPQGMLKHFVKPYFGVSDEPISAYQDRDSFQVRDFSIPLSVGSVSVPSDPDFFHNRLLSARFNPSDQPLKGLRIALDPGHMGGEIWDSRTGKFVRDARGRKLSEGVMALQVSVLLEERFKALGAEVLVTRRDLGPVTSETFEGIDLHTFGLAEMRENTLANWFQSLLVAGSANTQALFSAFSSSPRFRALFVDTEINRSKYFILREDLIARARVIMNFNADIALVIHFDTNDPPGNPNGVGLYHRDGSKVYVVGSYDPVEFSSREARMYMARHLFDATTSKASLDLGRSVVQHLARDLGVGFDTSGGGSSLQVEPGIFARNLAVSRRVSDRALTYVECLFYNDPKEFELFSDAHHPFQIGGQSYPYSDRLVQVTQAIQQGVVEFVKDYGKSN